MAVSCTLCTRQILCPNLPKPFPSKTLSSFAIFKFECSKLKQTKFNNPVFIPCAKLYSSLTSSSELDIGNAIIFIKGLAQSSSEERLRTTFSRFGEVDRVKVVNDKKTKQPLGFAFIWFSREEHALAAVEEMNGHFFDGRFIHVTIAKPGSCKPRQRASPITFKF